MWEALKAEYGEKHKYAKPSLAFHGTASKNIPSIARKGLLVPGRGAYVTACPAITCISNAPAESGIRHRTDNGYYGKGIYLSPKSSLSLRSAHFVFCDISSTPGISYCRGTGRMLVCACLRGKPKVSDAALDGALAILRCDRFTLGHRC